MLASSINHLNQTSLSYAEAYAEQLVETTWRLMKTMFVGFVIFQAYLLLMGSSLTLSSLAVTFVAFFGGWLLYQKRWYVIARYYLYIGALVGFLGVLADLGTSSFAYYIIGPLVLATMTVFQTVVERYTLALLTVLSAYLAITSGIEVQVISNKIAPENFQVVFVLLTFMLCYDLTGSFLEVSRDFRLRSKGMVEQLRNEEVKLHAECQKVEDGASLLELTNQRLQTEINNRVKVERELSSSNEQLSQFAYAASHDLKEPLRSISSFIQLIRRKIKGTEDDALEEHTSAVHESTSKMATLLDDLLIYSRVGNMSQTSELVDLNRVAEVVVHKSRKSLDNFGAVVDVSSLPNVLADRKTIESLFSIILSNCVRFKSSKRKPYISIQSGRISEGKIEILVTDNGIGINKKFRSQAFQLFKKENPSTSSSGSGIGLAIAQKIVHASGGEISFVSTNTQVGITCRVLLPAADTSRFKQ